MSSPDEIVTLRASDVKNIILRHSNVHATMAEAAAMYQDLIAELTQHIEQAERIQRAQRSTGFDQNSLLVQ